MKSPLLAAIAALQLATLGLVVGLLLRRNDPTGNADLERLTQALRGSVHQQHVITQYLEELRAMAAARAAGGTPAVPAATSEDPADPDSPASSVAGTPPAVASSSPFPLAETTLAEVKRMHQALRQEQKTDSNNLEPIKKDLDRRKASLIALGDGAVYVVQHEIDLQPFEPGRDADFVEYLLLEVVPPLSSRAKEEAFEMARGALVRQTNEARVKFAAAKALQQIDSEKWVKQVGDVVLLGGESQIELRSQLLGLFLDSPKPQAVDICRRFLEDARYASQLRTRAVQVIAKQDSSAVNPTLRKILFEDPAPMLKILALDALWDRLPNESERRKLAQDVVDEDPARMPDAVQVKARQLLEGLSAPKSADAGR